MIQGRLDDGLCSVEVAMSEMVPHSRDIEAAKARQIGIVAGADMIEKSDGASSQATLAWRISEIRTSSTETIPRKHCPI